MAKGTKHVLTVEAEVKQARKRLRELEDQVNQLAEKAGKGVKINFEAGGFGGIGQMIGTIGRFAGPQGIAATAAIATKKFADHVVGLSSELRAASEMSGVGIEELQRLTGVMKNVSLTASEAADIHKDVNEKIYEAVQSGTGEMAGVAKEYKLKFEEISKVMENGGTGIDALAKMYYMLREQGHTANEAASAISRVSDKGGELAHQFDKLGSETEYYRQKAQQSVNVTEEMAKKHAEYEQKSKDLGTAIDGIKVEVFQDLIVGMTDFFNTFHASIVQLKNNLELSKFEAPKLTGKAKEERDALAKVFNKSLKSERKGGLAGISNWRGKDKGLSLKEASLLVEMNLDPDKYFKHANNQMYRALQMAKEGKNFNNADARKGFRFTFDGKVYDGNYNQIEIVTNSKAGKKLNYGGGTEEKKCNKCGKKAHENGQKCPVDLAAAAQKLADDQLKKRTELAKRYNDLDVRLNSGLTNSITSQNKQLQESLSVVDNALKEGLISQEEAAEKRQALIDANADNVYKMVLGADPADALDAFNKLEQIRDRELANHKLMLENKAISYEEYIRRVNDTEQNYSQTQDALVSSGMAGRKEHEFLNSFRGEGLGSLASQQALEEQQAIDEYNAELARIDQNKGKMSEEALLKARELAEEKHQKNLRDIGLKYANIKLEDQKKMYGGMTDILTAFGLENSKVGKAIFAAQKGASIAQAMINAHESATVAMAKYPGPLGVAMGAVSYAAAAARAAQMKSIDIDGMAHDGIDNIPREGTWLLQKGERVVDDRTNGDLKEFLSAQKSNNNSGVAPIEVNAPLHINGNVNSADKMVMDAIKRHAQFVAQAVEDAQRRKM